MPVSYFESLKTQLTESATAKKAALDAAYDRATTATFDAAGKVSYKKDASGKNIYGTRDVQHLENVRNIGTSAESRGALRSGQTQRSLINNEADYRSDVTGAAATLTAQKGLVDTETGTKTAEYEALYGDQKSGGGGDGTSTSASGSTSAPSTAPMPITGPGNAILTPSSQKAMADAYAKWGGPSYGTPAKPGAQPTVVAKPAASAAQFRAKEEADKKKPVATAKPATPAKPAVPAAPAKPAAPSAAAFRAAESKPAPKPAPAPPPPKPKKK
jgi:hypothetical protein